MEEPSAGNSERKRVNKTTTGLTPKYLTEAGKVGFMYSTISSFVLPGFPRPFNEAGRKKRRRF
jgi:hypothetical protein